MTSRLASFPHRRSLGLAAAVACLLPVVGCFGYERTSTLEPTTTSAAALLGSWTSSSLIRSPQSCTDFQWEATEQTGNSASGSFSATCGSDMRVAGTARGTLSGSTVEWSAQATATIANLGSCAISLSGTAELQVDSIRVPYTGETCLGRVMGVEVLRKR
jgi:hypothetical protein